MCLPCVFQWVIIMVKETVLCRFRVNSKLKEDFSNLCKSRHVTPSSELRAFIKRSLISNRIDYSSLSFSTPTTPQAALSKVYAFRDSKQQASVDDSVVYDEQFELDTSFNFKVDSELKEQFTQHFSELSLSAELKRFMSHIVRKNI